jgi:FKBP-type peptidyl-prolyl cis-trans isomerase FkpA
MNLKWLAIVILFFFGMTAMAQNQPSMTDTQKLSYGAGVAAGKLLLEKKQKGEFGYDLDIDMVVNGILDAYRGTRLLASEEDVKKLSQKLEAEKLKAQADKNKPLADKFLLDAQAKGALILPSGSEKVRGVLYEIITEGDGPKPKETESAVMHVIGTFIDGKVFNDKSKDTVDWQVSKLIPGLKSALLSMPIGSKWKVIIPPEQAYGEKGNGLIEPNSVLIFEIELLGAHEAPAPQAPNQ